MTTLAFGSITMPAARLGPENVLPQFRSPENVAIDAAPDVPEEERRHLGWQIGYRVLPHRLQDDFDQAREPRAFQTAVLENEFLRATFLTGLGGRLMSLVHKPGGHELLSRNPVFQPGNLALRHAWFSGGIEWNPSHFGHHYLTCSPVFVAEVEGPHGEPVLRLYEWDRVKCFPWQIDFHLPAGSRFLFARMRMINSNDHEIPAYWWTNIAVPETAGTRVLVPAEDALAHVPPSHLGLSAVPVSNGEDITYAEGMRNAREFFFRIPGDRRRWIAALDAEGRGLAQVSTARLRGRKVFYWGMGRGGRRWQDFLSGEAGPYIEIQAGLARTQEESVPMPAGAEWTWTEAFGLMEADPAVVHGRNWRAAVETVETRLEKLLPHARLREIDTELAEVARRMPAKLISRGSGWGALERHRLARCGGRDRIPTELIFDDASLDGEQAPWMALLEKGALPETPPGDVPGAWMIQSEWREFLETAVNAGRGDHWLSWLHLGNMRMETFDADGARLAWETSLKRKQSSWALRNLAVLAGRDNRKVDALELMRRAWELGPGTKELAIEYTRELAVASDHVALKLFVGTLSPEIRQHERIHILAAKYALEAGDFATVEQLFKRSFAQVREGENILTDLWFAYHERRLAAAEGRPVDQAIRDRVRRDCPPPGNIDFRMVT
ncbi:MAG: DUF5107 domain-containing protein [Verrucomicrobia bacterium]|nr:DUF5107 domain-containing protein [Verrucomicrobiota bacterium]